MITLKEWVDFVIYPNNPDFVSDAKMRLDVSNSTDNSEELMLVEPEKRKALVTKELIFCEDADSFEAMSIDEYGKLIIWTSNKVWFLQRFSGTEKLHYVPRHPID